MKAYITTKVKGNVVTITAINPRKVSSSEYVIYVDDINDKTEVLKEFRKILNPAFKLSKELPDLPFDTKYYNHLIGSSVQVENELGIVESIEYKEDRAILKVLFDTGLESVVYSNRQFFWI